MQMVSTEHYWSHIVYLVVKSASMATRGSKNPAARFYEKKFRFFFKFHRTSDMHMGTPALSNHAYDLYGTFISLGGFCKVNKSAWIATGVVKIPGARFYEKEVPIVFKIHRTGDIHMGTLAQPKRANCLYKTFFNQGNV